MTPESLLAHIQELNRENLELRRLRDEDAWVEGSLRARTRQLDERMKELSCLLSVIELVRAPRPYRDKARMIAALLPRACRYPELCRARVVLDEERFAAPGFAETEWAMDEAVHSHGRAVGFVEVRFIRKPPERPEEPFPREERALLSSVAGCLGLIHERR
jgi:hypothetical protein